MKKSIFIILTFLYALANNAFADHYELHSPDEKITVKVNYSRITLDQTLSFPFTIPTKYDRIY